MDGYGASGVREIVLDTETTGLDPRSGHRIVELRRAVRNRLLVCGRVGAAGQSIDEGQMGDDNRDRPFGEDRHSTL